MNDDEGTGEPGILRAQLAEQLRGGGYIRTAEVERALRAVPRHLFLPGVPARAAYADQVVITKRDHHGEALISASQPAIVATMLEQLKAAPGERILEIGTGTGYNAALLCELTGGTGEVTTIEIDPEAAIQARARLAAAGYPGVHVLTGDGALGDTARAPFDRIIVTAGAWDVPPAWREQLADGGRIVVPLRWRGLTRSIAFDHHRRALVSRSVTLCGFVPLQGGDGERTLHLDHDVALHYDQDQPIDPAALHGVLDQPKAGSWSGVTVGPCDPFDGVWLRLSAAEPGTCRIAAQPSAVDRGRATPAVAKLNPALAEGGSLAYFTTRRLPGPGRRCELGAIGHGPHRAGLARRITEQIRTWDHDRDATPAIAAFPADTPDEQLPAGAVIGKRHIRLVISWPQ